MSSPWARPEAVVAMLHGTTVATNAILSMNGVRTAVVTTRGFRDVLEIGRLRRPVLYDLLCSKPEPLARRRHRYELDQRIMADGRLKPPAGEDEVRALATRLRADGIEAVAVCLLNSYVRPDEERRVAELLRAELPGVYVTDGDQVHRAFASLLAERSRLDILVNAAGIAPPTAFEDITEAEWNRVLAVNVHGTFLCCRRALPAMRRGRWGRIVNFSSTAGKTVSTAGGAHYSRGSSPPSTARSLRTPEASSSAAWR